MTIIDLQVHAYEANTSKRPRHSVPSWPPHVTGDEMVAAMDAVGVDGVIFISAFGLYQLRRLAATATCAEETAFRCSTPHPRLHSTPLRIQTFPDVSKQRQLHLAPLAHRQRHGVCPFHVFYSRNEIRVRYPLEAAHGVDELFLHPPGAEFCGIDRKRAHSTAFLTELQVRLGVVRRDEGQRAFVAENPGFGLARRVSDTDESNRRY